MENRFWLLSGGWISALVVGLVRPGAFRATLVHCQSTTTHSIYMSVFAFERRVGRCHSIFTCLLLPKRTLWPQGTQQQNWGRNPFPLIILCSLISTGGAHFCSPRGPRLSSLYNSTTMGSLHIGVRYIRICRHILRYLLYCLNVWCELKLTAM